MFNDSPIKHLKDFQRVLKHYVPNIEVIDFLKSMKLVLIAAPAAAGKNTIISNLIMTGKYYFVVSDTTRQPRINNGELERSGDEYWFKSEEDFLWGLQQGYYLEAEIIHNQQVSGMSLGEIRHAFDSGKIAISDITLNGCESISQFKSDAICVFVLPPSYDEWMRRLEGRGAISSDEKKRRMESAYNEISLALKKDYFHFVINWDLKKTIYQLHEYIVGGVVIGEQQDQAKAHALDLLQRLKKDI